MFGWFKKDIVDDTYDQIDNVEMFVIDNQFFTGEPKVPLKEIFLNYVETQRAANDERSRSDDPAFDPVVKQAYEKANMYKRKMLDAIEEIENK